MTVRFDLGGGADRVVVRRVSTTERQRKRKRAGEKLFWVGVSAIAGYSLWRFMESGRERGPAEVIVIEEEEGDYDE